MNNQLSLDDTRKAQEQLAIQFSEIGRLLVLSNQETLEQFLEQKESDLIPRDHLPAVEGILLGSPIIPIEVFRDIAVEVLKKHKFCTIIRVLHKMTNGNLLPELVNYSLKMTAAVITPEAQPGPNIN